MYDDRSSISGGGNHVVNTRETGSLTYISKKSAFTAKLAQCWTGPYKIAFIRRTGNYERWKKSCHSIYYYWSSGRMNQEDKSMQEFRIIV